MTTDTKDLYVTLPLEVHTRLRVAAGARGLTYAQYIEALVKLHEKARAVAFDKQGMLGPFTASMLRSVGLETVTA